MHAFGISVVLAYTLFGVAAVLAGFWIMFHPRR